MSNGRYDPAMRYPPSCLEEFYEDVLVLINHLASVDHGTVVMLDIFRCPFAGSALALLSLPRAIEPLSSEVIVVF